MDNEDQWQRVKALFADVLNQPAAERETFLDAAAGDDAELIASVRSLLESSSNESTMHDVIQSAASDITGRVDFPRIENYEIQRLIGEGGMGDVFLAKRSGGSFDQEVAIKVLGLRRPGEDILRRFRAERQILANLEHPNIARLIDGGETADGAPYLVMEYVDGRTVTDFCDAQQLGTRERLKVFLQICAAVQHAHRNLIIHRDIKPGNILVTGSGQPKLLDFGIAKLLDGGAFDQTMVQTMDSARLMTPRHASPEQVQGSTVSVATDVYALGVLLYELLSGSFPYEVSSGRTADVERAICDTDPVRPSARLTQPATADAARTIASARKARLHDLVRQIGGDLDTIVLKAMRKEPERRYSTVGELAEDVKLYLDLRPITARRDSMRYRIAKFVRRNVLPVSAGVLATTVAVAATGVAFVRVSAERDLAESERQKAEAVSDFMQQIFSEANPETARGEQVTAQQLLEEGARRIEVELAEQPDVQATLMRTLGDVYYQMGDWDSAERFMRDAQDRLIEVHGDEHPEIAATQLVLGFVAQDRGDLDRAADLIGDAHTRRETFYGRRHMETVETFSARAFLAEMSGDFVTAEALHAEALAIARDLAGGDDIFVAEMMTKLAGLYRVLGRNDEAESLLVDALAMQDRLYGGEHPQSSDTKRQIAGVYRETRRYAQAEALYKEVIDERVRMLGPDHMEVAHTWNSYSQLLSDMQDFDRAIEAHQVFIDILERTTDGPHPSFGAAYNNFALMLKQQGNIEEALRYYQLSIDMQDAVDLPARHPNRSFPLDGMAGSAACRRGL